MKLFVPLDVNYLDDDKILTAGAQAELLYVRSLALAKRSMTDGHVKRAQLVHIRHGLRTLERHISALVDVGLWVETDDGWLIAGWQKHNPTRDQIEAKSLAKRRAAHVRWHCDPDDETKIVKPSTDCPFCPD